MPALRDRIAPNLRVLFVGINPGMRSATVGHHFAGPSNRFWKLLHESALVSEPVTWRDDDRLPAWGLGITNLVGRATPGIGDLHPSELVAGRRALVAKIGRYKPAIVALVGVTIYRALFPRAAATRAAMLGAAPERLAGARVFVLPNPSGRNANYTYAEMLDAFRRLRDAVNGPISEWSPSARGSRACRLPDPRTARQRAASRSRA
jgi:double-stranded uracil-DNA glycosylase